MAKKVRKKVDEIRFSLLSPEQIKKISSAKIVTPELYDIDSYPVDGGLMDLKYVPLIESGMRCFCHECGKLLLGEADLKKYSLSERAKKAKDVKRCPHCSAAHEKVKLEKPTSFYIGKKRLFPTEVRETLANR